MITDTVDDFPGSTGIVDDTGERFPDFTQIRPVLSKKRMAAQALLRAVTIGWVIS